MRKIISIIGVLMLIVNGSSLYAQTTEETEEQNDSNLTSDTDESQDLSNPFQIEMKVGTQSPWSKKVPVEVIFTPKFDSSRTQVDWDIPLGLEVEKKYQDFFDAKKGETYSVEALIDPQQPGTYNIVVNITNWGYGSNVTSSSKMTLTFDQSRIVEPRTAGFQTASTIRYIVVLGSLVLIGIGIFFGAKKGMRSLQAWLKPPQ